jgi:hypothetical protein
MPQELQLKATKLGRLASERERSSERNMVHFVATSLLVRRS